MRDFGRFVEECDSLVKAGRVADAAKRLNGLNTAQVPREWKLPLANLCRRTGLITTGMKLLFREIHPLTRRPESEAATPGELAEYGVLLHRFGSLAESVEILKRADPIAAPESLLFQAFCHFNRWEYADAVPMLERYVSIQSSPYQRFIGQVNLSAALVWSEQWDRGLEVVSRNVEFAKANSYGRLQGNSHELRAQIHIYKRNFEKARLDLDESAKLLGTTGVLDSLFVRKWRIILEAFETKDVSKLLELKKEAIERRDGETAREADRFRLLISFDQATFDRLLFGTPYPEFRRMLCRQMRRMPSKVDHTFGDENASRTLDAKSGEIFDANSNVIHDGPGGKCHQVLDVLSADLYRPTRLGGLFAELFPGEYFDVFSSPGRVHQILFRTRAWAKENDVPVSIKENDGFYSLELGADFAIRVPYDRSDVSAPAIQWRKLSDVFGPNGLFSAREAREKLGLPRTTFQRLISWAESQRKVERLGESSATRYRIAG